MVYSQDALRPDVDKPAKFEDKKLGYEKTGDKKFTAPRRFMQNTTTHYNYYFNANDRLNAVIDRAKSIHRDKYTQLLSFYNYTLEQTSADKVELDSVIYKVTTGILIHDLRNNWLDNMYLLLGKAYYFRNELDTAFRTFQYINYAFAPKEKDGYDKVIGSNENDNKGLGLSISTNEKTKGIKKLFEQPPSRNESLIWQIRTFIQMDQYAEAEGLIETLNNDPNFPARLRTDLWEVKSFWFYKQNMLDSSAKYLALALDNASSSSESARWEYLIAQMYERTGQNDNAEQYYTRAMRHAYDPVMEVFARLNALRQTKGDKENTIKQNIDELVKMGRRDKYFNYRDVIYYTAAQMELERHNEPGAMQFLLKSARYSKDNPDQRNLSFLELADLSFKNRDYRSAKNYYDSVNATPGLIGDMGAFNQRKQTVASLLTPLSRIEREDSLQKIAAMPQAEREAYLKKLVRQLRKAEGLKEEVTAGGTAVNTANDDQTDLFNKADKGVWYFDNASLKAKGYTEFKSKWGTRPNVDNWRRISAVTQFAQAKPVDNQTGNAPPFSAGSTEISYDALAANLPLTPEKLKVSNDTIEAAYMAVGKAYQDQLEDYPFAVGAYEKLLSRFPNTVHKEDAWFNLYYSYWKMKDDAKANYYKSLLMQNYPAGKYVKALNPGSTAPSPDSILKTEATDAYSKIYNLFIEGQFDSAVAAKKDADAMYGNKFWTPQLSYIEAVYYIRQRNDSAAKQLLSDLVYRFRTSPMYSKAQTLLDVLNRRKEIETYLTNLQVVREGEDTSKNVTAEQKPAQTQAPVTKNDGQVTQNPNKVLVPVVQQPVKKDSVQKAAPAAKTYFTFNAQGPQLVMVALDKVDPVYVTETRNAFNRYNRENYYNKTFEINNIALDENLRLVVIKSFENAETAIDYLNKAKKVAGSDIIPWLPAGKYTFYMISAENLDVLLTNKDLNQYKQEMMNAYPGKF
jgi:hypothetical protein